MWELEQWQKKDARERPFLGLERRTQDHEEEDNSNTMLCVREKPPTRELMRFWDQAMTTTYSWL